ncbi:unnamed protein product [Leptidea sinapis]|uniref:Ionotropic glutamate receptor C-terminal domain-containing protein n=1 Tax=Leptidea sinapis TaxID=189913 RepID=A0A5E4Q3L9_9NEOP|nr:unnamed protein product [Leptidea sinapis]
MQGGSVIIDPFGNWKMNTANNEAFLLQAVTNALYFHDIDITPILRFLPFHMDYYDVIHQPVTHVEARYFYRIPTTGVGKFENQFLTPFSIGVWWCVFGILLMCALGLLISAALEGRPQSTAYAVFSVVALTCQQYFEDASDAVVRRNTIARKLTILITGLSCLLMYNYYTSSVVSWLLNGPPPSINTLWELLDSPLQPAFEDVGYTQSWLQLSDYYYNKKNSDAENVLKKRIKKKGNIILTSPAEGIEMVKRGAEQSQQRQNVKEAHPELWLSEEQPQPSSSSQLVVYWGQSSCFWRKEKKKKEEIKKSEYLEIKKRQKNLRKPQNIKL